MTSWLNFVTTTQIFNPAKAAPLGQPWSPGPPLSNGGFGFAATVQYGDSFLVFGGHDDSASTLSDAIWYLNAETEQLERESQVIAGGGMAMHCAVYLPA